MGSKKKTDKQADRRRDTTPGLAKGVMVAYAILALHVLLIAGIGILVLFFRGVVSYMGWIMLGGLVLICLSAFFFIRRMRAEKKSLQDMLRDPLFGGRTVEVSLLGGMATVKLGPPSATSPAIGYDPAVVEVPLLAPPTESAHTSEVSQLAELARLLEKNLITVDEFNAAKQRLLNS
ncbi:SHOCT domain-containing protein [Desulfosarcina sp. OttesenSCG-928-G10]|nr:SHOCT domain-containing protein [Desulfosarcina sp. OttesenSCG-928-G10]